MNQKESMGFVETIGLVAAIEAADIMVKAANVKIETVANADSGLITVICTGDLASCNAAVDAAKGAISQKGAAFSSNRIPRPSSEVQRLISDHIENMLEPGTTETPKTPAKQTRKGKK